VFLTGCCGSTRRIIRASASILPRSGREGLRKRTKEGTVPDGAAVLIAVPRMRVPGTPIFFDPKSVTAGWLGSSRKRVSRDSNFLAESDS
jgi:hypothetical protein